MYSSTSITGGLLCGLLLALAIGCQQQAESIDEPTEANAADQSQSDDVLDDQDESQAVKTVTAEQPIQAEMKTVEPDFLAAPLESEVAGERDAPVLIIDLETDELLGTPEFDASRPSFTEPSPRRPPE